MIVSFGNQLTEDLYNGINNPKLRRFALEVQKASIRKLDMIEYAVKLTDLKAPPANHLEALKGNLKGYYSIRVNDQWRIIFKWHNNTASNVKLTDYH